MCDKCFRRSALIMTALMAAPAAPPPEQEEDRHKDGEDFAWSQRVIDSVPALAGLLAEYRGDSSPDGTDPATMAIDNKIDDLFKGLNTCELVAVGTLCEAFRRHFSGLAKMTVGEVRDRATKGDEKAIDVISAQAGKALQEVFSKAMRAGSLAEALSGIGVELEVVNLGAKPDGLVH